jgi:hypothetical protein
VFLVEDETLIRMMVAGMVEELGHAVPYLIAVRLSVGPMFWRVRIALLVLEGTELTADKYFA